MESHNLVLNYIKMRDHTQQCWWWSGWRKKEENKQEKS